MLFERLPIPRGQAVNPPPRLVKIYLKFLPYLKNLTELHRLPFDQVIDHLEEILEWGLVALSDLTEGVVGPTPIPRQAVKVVLIDKAVKLYLEEYNIEKL